MVRELRPEDVMGRKRADQSDGAGQQPGPQDHAEGDHGPKTRAWLRQQMQSGAKRRPSAESTQLARTNAAYHGKRRLVEDRQQHDEAEKNSERRRRAGESGIGDRGSGRN